MNSVKRTFKLLLQYPSAVIGLIIVGVMFAVAIYALISMSYSEAVRLWRGGEGVWIENPRTARPAWINLWPGNNMPPTIKLDSAAGDAAVEREELSPTLLDKTFRFQFDYTYDGFPQEFNIFYTSVFDRTRPHVTVTWITPDGREISMGDYSVGSSDMYRASQDSRLQRRVGGLRPEVGLFVDPEAPGRVPLKGTYELRIEALLFEAEGDIDVRMVSYGQVHGMAGTDHRRRDLMVALLWGTPIALAFGFLAAVGATISTMIIAAIGVWFGRGVDATIQRITEVNLILPIIPILVMVGTFYSRSIWVMLGVVILLNVFSAGIKTFRAMFLQIKESPYIEAAKSYGAGNLRIVFRYMIPKVVPVLLPTFVTLIPTFVFLEASLAVLGLGDPVLPTWGKVLNDAFQQGALYTGHHYWVLEPSFLLILMGLGFAMVGFALDRIFNPRLRGV